MTTNVIKQIVSEQGDGVQSIKMIVRSNERGPEGVQGIPGEAATIEAGQAYSVPAGSQPAVMNVGTSSNAKFDFYIPKGEAGERGEKGEPGRPGVDGAIQYTAGSGINISSNHVISATGGEAKWGEITGNITDQTDLINEIDTRSQHLTAGDAITITNNVISADIKPKDYFTNPRVSLTARLSHYTSHTTVNWLEGQLAVKIGGDLYQTNSYNSPSPTNPSPINYTAGSQIFRVDAGSQLQQYDLHLGSLELYGLNDFARDYFYNYLGDWYLKRKVSKIVFDGSEDESWETSGLAFRIEVVNLKKSEVGLCDYFKGAGASQFDPNDSSFRGKFSCNVDDTYIYFMPTDTTQTTVADFKAWLALHPITVYYAISEASVTSTKITDTTLIDDLNKLKMAKSGEWATTVSIEHWPAPQEHLVCYIMLQAPSNTLINTETSISQKVEKVGIDPNTHWRSYIHDIYYGDQRPYLVVEDRNHITSTTDIEDGLFQKGQVVYDTTDKGFYVAESFEKDPITHDISVVWKALATDEYVNGKVQTSASAPTTATAGTVGQLLEDTTNGDLYICTAVTAQGTTPETYTYTWEEVGGGAGPTVVQTTGTSTTDVMSQNAATSMIFNDPAHRTHIVIGYNAGVSQPANGLVAIGKSAKSRGDTVSIGYGAGSLDPQRNFNVNLGTQAICGSNYSVALGYYSKTTRNGELNIGSGNYPYGFNSTAYRVLGGVHDGQDNHDAATVAQGNTLSTSAPTTSTEGVLGQLWTDTTNMHTYQCTAISGGVYTWTQRW